jgi:type II secretory pathway pseudopilin PulG
MGRTAPARDWQAGTLLLDALTAIAILSVIFAVSYPNYARAQAQSAFGTEARQLDEINTATLLYQIDHGHTPPPEGAITATNPGSVYLQATPESPIGVNGYQYGATPEPPAPYVIVDTNPITDVSLLGNYTTYYGVDCSSLVGLTLYLADDPIHGPYCVNNTAGNPWG